MGKSNLYIEIKYCKNTRCVNNAMIRIYNNEESYYLISDNGRCSIDLDVLESNTYNVDIKAKGFKNEVIKDLTIYCGMDSILKVSMIPINHNVNIENTTFVNYKDNISYIDVNINANKVLSVPIDIIIKQCDEYKCVNYLDYVKYVVSSMIKVTYTNELIKVIARLVISNILSNDNIIVDKYHYTKNHVIYVTVDKIIDKIFDECILLKNSKNIYIGIGEIEGNNEIDKLKFILDEDYELVKLKVLDIDNESISSIDLYKYYCFISYNNNIKYIINSYSDICTLKGKSLLAYLINCLSLFFDNIIATNINNKEDINFSIECCKQYLNITKKSNYKVMINYMYILFCEVEDKLFDNLEHTKVLYDGSIIELEIDTILEIQEILNNLAKEYSWLNFVKINGVYDNDTKIAIKKIQRYAGLKQDGLINKKVYNLIKSLDNSSDSNNYNYIRYNVRDMQSKFNVISRYYNDIKFSNESGILDNNTIYNYIAFQMLLGLKVDTTINNSVIRLIDSMWSELV